MSMMGNPKPFASLSSGLLARKGQARPAMRPQGYVGLSPVPSSEDLGWNDMGYEMPPMEPVPAPVQAEVPPVVRQREMLDQQFGADVEDVIEQAEPTEAEIEMDAETPRPPLALRPVSDGTLRRIGRETKAKKGAKAAFTLRLDAERHLRLRLASAVANRSAQQIVSDALDQFLDQLPELDSLVDRVPGRRGR